MIRRPHPHGVRTGHESFVILETASIACSAG